MNSQKLPLKNSLCLLLAATIWGIAFVAQSVGMEYVGPFTFNGVRSLIGAAVLVPVLFILNRSGNKSSAATDSAIPESSSTPSEKAVSPTPYNSRDLWLGGIACGFALFAASSFQQFGIQYTTVGKAGFITACYIVIVPIIGIFLKKKCSPFIWAAVVMALVGLYLLCITDGFSIDLGDILVLVNGEYVTLEKTQHEILEAPITVYNFEVEDYHTYYVGTDGVLVHNACSQRAAMRKAKRSENIPMSQKPTSVKHIKMTGANGRRYYARVEVYGNKYIRNDWGGHLFKDGATIGRHYNAGTIANGKYLSNGKHFWY